MKASAKASAILFALLSLVSLLLLLLAFAAGVRSSAPAAAALLLGLPAGAAVAAFKTTLGSAAIASAFSLPLALYLLWSSTLTQSAKPGISAALVSVVLVLCLFSVLWLAARFGKHRRTTVHHDQSEL